MLYVQDPCNDSLDHFAWIKNLLRLVSSDKREKEQDCFCDR